MKPCISSKASAPISRASEFGILGMTKHFLDIHLFPSETLREILDRAITFKKSNVRQLDLLRGRTLVMIFEKASTRTRVSFEVGMRQLGGHVITLSSGESQLGRGETIGDT